MDNRKPTLTTRSSAVSVNVQDVCRRLPQELQHLKARIVALLNRHSDFESFSRVFDPKQQEYCAKNEILAVTNKTAPSLTVIQNAYGDTAVLIWLCKQLADFNEFCGKREKMDEWQIEQLAKGIILYFGYLKASEIMLFLYQYKMGQWGPLYGVIDPQELMTVLRDKFMPWRAKILNEEKNEQFWQERDQWRKNKAKPEEIQKIKERINQINNKFQVNKGDNDDSKD